jgi:predicted nucleic acid-binding protein
VLTLDANVIIAITNEDDACHLLAREVVDSYEWEEFVTTTLTLAEVLVRPVRVEQFDERRDVVEDLGVGLVGVDGPAVRPIAELCAAHRLSTPDAAVLAVAMSVSDALVTFDKRLARAARNLGFPVIDRPDDESAAPEGVGADDAPSFGHNAPAWREDIPPGR